MPTGQYSVADAKQIGEYSLSDVGADEQRTSAHPALGLTAGVPVAARIAEEVATNPNVPRAVATVGRVIGGAAPIVGGATVGGLPGAAIGVAGAAKGAWAGGKTGWFTGKLAQTVAAPIATALNAIAPYANAATAAQAEGAVNTRGEQYFNDPKEQVKSVQYLIDTKGLTPSEAVKRVTDNDSRLFGPLMTLYMRSRMKP